MRRRPRVLAIASAGGHWVQLLRLRPAWDGCEVTYVTTEPSFRTTIEEDAKARGIPVPSFFSVREANRWHKLPLLQQVVQIFLILRRVRPDVIVSTGAAPGYFAIRLGKMFGARTIWLDSIALADEVSLSCRKVRPYADLWLTQWPHLAADAGHRDRPKCLGAVL